MNLIDRIPEPVVVWEDRHLIAVNKPPGMPTQGDDSGDPTLVDWVQAYLRTTYNKPGDAYVALLHRLDRPTGGIILLAKRSKAAQRMSELFKKRRVEKTYLAVVPGRLRKRSDELRHYLDKVPGKTNIMRAYPKPGPGRKEAQLSYLVVAEAEGHSLLEVRLMTGRKHQIRVQLGAIGFPVIGDLRYGRGKPLPDRSIGLLAQRLQFIHPVGEPENIDVRISIPSRTPWRRFGDLVLG
ncbi:MAG: RluA family pseudouridine synthase [Bacteroidota bacterium]